MCAVLLLLRDECARERSERVFWRVRASRDDGWGTGAIRVALTGPSCDAHKESVKTRRKGGENQDNFKRNRQDATCDRQFSALSPVRGVPQHFGDLVWNGLPRALKLLLQDLQPVHQHVVALFQRLVLLRGQQTTASEEKCQGQDTDVAQQQGRKHSTMRTILRS